MVLMFLVPLNLFSRSSTPIQNIGYEFPIKLSIGKATILWKSMTACQMAQLQILNTIRVEKVSQQNKWV